MTTDQAFERERSRLWEVAADWARLTGDEAWSAFESVGLLLEEPGASGWDYDATPLGAETFASTGGDGVHFSWVESIVVMTVPTLWDRANLVVGRSLREFLALGCQVGFFALEGLAHDPGATIDSITEASDDGPEALAFLRRELDLEPWPSVAERLSDLAGLVPAARR